MIYEEKKKANIKKVLILFFNKINTRYFHCNSLKTLYLIFANKIWKILFENFQGKIKRIFCFNN